MEHDPPVWRRLQFADYVKAGMRHRSWNNTDLAQAAGIDAGTVGDIVNESRDARPKTQAKIERAFAAAPAGGIFVSFADAQAAGSYDGARNLLAHGGRGGVSEFSLQPGIAARGRGEALPASRVLMSLPPDALEGLTPAEQEEVRAAAELTALERARTIRERINREKRDKEPPDA